MSEPLIPTPDAREVLELARAMKALLVDKNYLVLQEVTKKQIAVWQSLALQAASSAREARQREYQKGVIYGITLNLDTPSRIIADAQDILFRMENKNGKRSVPVPGEPHSGQYDFFTGASRDSAESIAEQLGEPVGPDARVTADSN